MTLNKGAKIIRNSLQHKQRGALKAIARVRPSTPTITSIRERTESAQLQAGNYLQSQLSDCVFLQFSDPEK